MDRICELELTHMVEILRGPFGAGWKAYLWDKAQRLAAQPVYAELPELLTAAMREGAE